MPFETTDVAAQVGKQQPDGPIKAISSLAELQNTLNQNKLFQAKTRAGQYLEQSTGPDGQPDLGKFSTSLQSDPVTAPYAQEALQGVATLRGTGLQNQQAGLGVAKTQFDNARGILATAGNSSKSTDPNTRLIENRRSAVTQLAQGVQAGLLSPELYTTLVNSPEFDSTIRSATIAGAGGEGAQTAMTGKVQLQQTPQGIQSLNVNPYAGDTGEVNSVGGNSAFTPNKLGPQDLASPVDVVDGEGKKSRQVLGDFLTPEGTWKPGKTPPLIDAGPLNNTARAALGSAYGPQISNFEAEVSAAPQTKALIEQMRSSVGQFKTGPNSDFWRKMGELANEYHLPIGDVSKTSASEVFNKIVPSLIRQQATMLGMNETDTGRQIAAAAVASKDLTEEGINKVLGIIEGNTDAISAQGKIWAQQKAKHGEGTYGNFRMEFPSKVPPTIFQSQYMTPEELKDMQKNWSPKQKADWEARKELAKKNGWLPNAQ